MTVEEKKEEAIVRMEMLNLAPKVIEKFTVDRTLSLSYGEFLFYLNDIQKEKIHNFEMETDHLVYHVIYDRTGFGDMLTLLYVSKCSDEWEQEREDINEGFPMAYVINMDNDIYSEFGSVGVKSSCNGGLIRMV